VLRRIESRGALETAHRARIYAGLAFRYALHTGRADRDPASDLRGALPPKRDGHFSAATNPEQLGDLLRALDGYKGSPVVAAALKLARWRSCAGRATQRQVGGHRPGQSGVGLHHQQDRDAAHRSVGSASSGDSARPPAADRVWLLRVPIRTHQRAAHVRQRDIVGHAPHGHRQDDGCGHASEPARGRCWTRCWDLRRI